jgi:SAM-dependent methyltransferase
VALGYSVVAFDPAPSGVKVARQGDRAVEAVVRSIEDPLLPAWHAAFDAVVSLEVIEHLFEPALLVEKARLALTPGGTCIVSTPYHGYLKLVAIAVSGRGPGHFDPLWDGGHIKFFTVSSLRQILSRGGLREIRVCFAGRLPWLWKSMVASARKCDLG